MEDIAAAAVRAVTDTVLADPRLVAKMATFVRLPPVRWML
jgi:hypothetical protein